MVGNHRLPVEIDEESGTITLSAPVRFEITDLCGVEVVIDIPAGFRCDGASIPRLFWPLVGHPLSGGPLRAAIVHDHLCNVARTPRARRFADTVFVWIMEEQQVSWLRRMAMFWAVRLYGVLVWPWERKKICRRRPDAETTSPALSASCGSAAEQLGAGEVGKE